MKKRWTASRKKENVQVEWKSFQLNPGLQTDPGKSATDYLMEIKGWTREQAAAVNKQVTEMAAAEGLEYNMNQTVLANSYDAHRVVQLAKEEGIGSEMEERLFKAYFTEGKNIADHPTLVSLAGEIGLDTDRVKMMLSGKEYEEHVENDIYESQQIGVRGVPYFVLNDKYAVSGAQAAEVFAGALEKAMSEWKRENLKSSL
ncbi:MAG: DsbA family oxidoreductase [Chitinophagaceae bacterium]|nr:DsbA family oxidoreductase [Chitinophagaceae bacterium]